MSVAVLLPALTSLLAFVFALALLDQWIDRRRGFQAIWALGMLFFGVASAAEAIGAAGGWSEFLYRTWYLTGAVFTAAWLGLGTAYLLGKTRFGYAYAFLVFFGGFLAFVTRNTYNAGTVGVLVLIAALIIAIAIAVETYFQNERWPQIAALTVVVASILGAYFAFTDPLTAALPTQDVVPTGTALTGPVRSISLFMNVPGGIRADPGRALLGVHLHAQEARPGLLARCRTVGRPVPVQHLPGDRCRAGQLRCVAAGRDRRPVHREDPQPRAGHAAHRHRRNRRQQRGCTVAAGLHELLLGREACRAGADLCWLPDLDRGLPRDPHPVHAPRPARRHEERGH